MFYKTELLNMLASIPHTSIDDMHQFEQFVRMIPVEAPKPNILLLERCIQLTWDYDAYYLKINIYSSLYDFYYISSNFMNITTGTTAKLSLIGDVLETIRADWWSECDR